VWSKQVEIVNELGLHARSAARIAAIAGKATRKVWLYKGDERADASSIIDILTLGCPRGTRLTVAVEHRDDLPRLNDIADLIAAGFGE
jgi:phosphotransferase system HPr (HPr) family protein